MMTIKDIEKYANDGVKEGCFNRLMCQMEELPQLLFENIKADENGNAKWTEAENYIKQYSLEKTGNYHTYFLNSISSSGSIKKSYYTYERNYKGYRFVITYKGVSYLIEALKNGDIHSVDMAYSVFRGYSSHIQIKKIESLETINSEAIEIITKDKRQVMNWYNKEIKKLKREYRDDLNKRNILLSKVSQ